MQEEAVSGLVNEERYATATVTLWGMGGGGKTVLALSVVRDNRVRSSFRHGIFWFHFGQEGKASVALILEQLAREIAVAPTDTPHLCPNKFDSAEETLWHVSATIKSNNLRCLVVLDNVWDVEVVNTFANTGIHVLVTTRKRTVIPPMYRGVMVEVGDMEEMEALELLGKTSHARGTLPTEAKQVADDCYMLPLALGMAGAMVKDQPLDALSWRTVHETLQKKDIRLEEMRSEEMTSQNKRIFSTIHASVDVVPRTVREQLRLMAVLASGVAASSDMLASLWEVDVGDVETDATVLVDRCLLQVVNEEYRLHDLVLEYLQMTVKMYEDLANKACSRQARFLARIEVLRRYSDDDKLISSGGLYSLVALWSAVKKLDGSLIVKEFYRKSLRGVTETEVMHIAGHLFQLLGKYDDAEPLYKHALAIREETLGPRHPDVAASLNILADLLKSQGKYNDAEPLYKRALAIREETLGPRHADVAGSLNNLAILLESQGKYDDAEPLYKRAVAIHEETLGPRHPDVASSLNILAILLASQGKYGDAEPLYKRALAIREETLGPRHPDVAGSLNNLAILLESQGKYDDAEPLYKRALAIREETLGPRHPDVAASLHILADLLASQGKYGDAEQLYKRAVAIREETLGPRHPDVAGSLNNLAILLASQGKYADAEPLHKRALATREETLGPRHPDVAGSLNNLAILLASQGKYDDAEPLYKRALAIREEMIGPRHPDVAASLHNLAILLKSQGKYDDAEPLYKRALAIREETLGPRHPDVAGSLHILADLLASQGKYDDAEPLYKRALAIREETLGPRHPDVAASLNNLAILLASQGKYGDAEPLYKRALVIQQETLGPRHPDVAGSLNNLAILLASQGKYGDAEPIYKRAVAIREETLGPRHRDVAGSLNYLADLLNVQGKYGDAEPLYKRALAIQQETLGPRHPDVAGSLYNLVTLLKSQGKYDDVKTLYKRALAIREETLGPRHPDVAGSLHNLVTLLKSQGKYDDVEPLYKRALAIREEMLGPRHPDAAGSLHNLVTLLKSQSKYDDAVPLYKRALAIHEEKLGPPHPQVTGSLNSLAALLASQGDISQDSGETVKPGGQPEENVAEGSDTVIVDVLPPVQAEGWKGSDAAGSPRVINLESSSIQQGPRSLAAPTATAGPRSVSHNDRSGANFSPLRQNNDLNETAEPAVSSAEGSIELVKQFGDGPARFSLHDAGVRLNVDRDCLGEDEVAGPINVQIDKQYLIECNDKTFLTSVVVDCQPSRKTFKKPLGLDFRVGGPLYEGSEADEDADEPGEGAGYNLDEAQREEHMNSLRDTYKVLVREGEGHAWHILGDERIMVLYEEGVFFIRASIDHFSQGCLAKKINPHSSIHLETVTWPKRPGKKEIEFVNATKRALTFLVLPTTWSNIAMKSVEMGVEVEGVSANVAISRAVEQAILVEAIAPQLFQVPALELNETPRAGQECPYDTCRLPNKAGFDARVLLITVESPIVSVWNSRIISHKTRVAILPKQFSEGMSPLLGRHKYDDLAQGGVSIMTVALIAMFKAELRATKSPVSTISGEQKQEDRSCVLA